jgi:hypothetical protein
LVGCLRYHGYPVVGFLRSAGRYYGSNDDGAYWAAHDSGVDDHSAADDASNSGSEVRRNVGHYLVDGYHRF